MVWFTHSTPWWHAMVLEDRGAATCHTFKIQRAFLKRAQVCVDSWHAKQMPWIYMGGMSEARVQALILHFVWRRSEELLQPFAGFCIVVSKSAFFFSSTKTMWNPKTTESQVRLSETLWGDDGFPCKATMHSGWLGNYCSLTLRQWPWSCPQTYGGEKKALNFQTRVFSVYFNVQQIPQLLGQMCNYILFYCLPDSLK